MKAYVLNKIGDLSYENVPVPELRKDWALIKVKAAGICSSDIPRIYERGTYHFPTIPGHEFAGEVVKVNGEKYNDIVGKRVAVFPLIPCGKCKQCKNKLYEMCENYDYIGSRRNGAFAQKMKPRRRTSRTKVRRRFVCAMGGCRYAGGSLQDVGMFLHEYLQALLPIVGVDDDVGALRLRKGIHVLDEDVLFGQTLQNLRQGAGPVGAVYGDHLREDYGEACVAEGLHGAVHLLHYEPHEAEICRFRDAESQHVDVIGGQYPCHFVQTAALVFQENRNLLYSHNPIILIVFCL